MAEPVVRGWEMGLRAFRGEGLRAHLLRGSVASIALKVFCTAASLGTAVILARILGPEGYGTYAYALALVTLLSVPAQFGLPTLVVREVAAYHVKEQWGLMRGLLLRANQAVVAVSLGFAAVTGAIALALGERFSQEQLATFAWALVLLPLIALGNLRGAALQGLRHVVTGQLPEQLLRPGMLVVLLLLFVVFFGSHTLTPPRAMAMHALAALTAFTVGAWLLARALPAQAKMATTAYNTRAWMRSALPLAFLAGMQIINGQTDIVMLGIFRPADDVGVYRVVVQGAALVIFTLNAVNVVLAPNISRLYAAGEKERLQRMITWSARVILLTALPVAGLFIFFGDSILGAVFGDEYVRGSTALAILCLGQLVNAGMGSVGYLLNMTGHERDTATGVAVAAGVNVVLNLALIPPFGMEGAAVATATSLIIWNLFLVWQVYRRIGIISTVLWGRNGSGVPYAVTRAPRRVKKRSLRGSTHGKIAGL